MNDQAITLCVACLVITGAAFAMLACSTRFFMAQIQTLVDKCKSSSFESYSRATQPQVKAVTTEEPTEDPNGGVLQEFQPF